MAKQRKKRARKKRPRSEWIGDAVPASLDADVVVWVERASGELLTAELTRSTHAHSVLERTARQLIEQRGKPTGRLVVPSATTAQRLRKALPGVAVGDRPDDKAIQLLEDATAEAPCLREETVVTLTEGEPTFTLLITLREVTPKVWRRVRIAKDASLGLLHEVLQSAMSWQDDHLHRFSVRGVDYGMDDGDAPESELDEHAYQLGELLKKRSKATYVYDFGDNWTHDIVVEQVGDATAGDPVASCLDGEHACPPEDSGGAPGYAYKLGVLAGPQSEERQELLEWLGEDFDAEAFDRESADRQVRALFSVGGASRHDEEDWSQDDEDAFDEVSELAQDPDFECSYDADRGPTPCEWLALDEDEQHIEVMVFHQRSDEPVPATGDFLIHAALHAIIENQVAANDPALVGQTLSRMLDEGLSRHQAIHAVASALTDLLHDFMNEDPRQQPHGFDEIGYARNLKKLTAKGWLQS